MNEADVETLPVPRRPSARIGALDRLQQILTALAIATAGDLDIATVDDGVEKPRSSRIGAIGSMATACRRRIARRFDRFEEAGPVTPPMA